MAQVTLQINGFSYVVVCEDGQEEHLQAMAAQVERRIDSVKSIGGQSGEARMLVLAGLLMADELHDMKQELERARPARAARAEAGHGDPALARSLGKLADRAEKIASKLEGA